MKKILIFGLEHSGNIDECYEIPYETDTVL